LYEILTGKLPFPSNDPLERVYSHIPVSPIDPHQIYSEIPAAISEIVINWLANAIDCFEESNQGRTYAEIAA
jgi:serine/threonine protein kinase